MPGFWSVRAWTVAIWQSSYAFRPGPLGRSGSQDVEAVAYAVAATFARALPAGETIAILLEPAPRDGDAPMALRAPTPAGEFVVRVNVRGTYWARLVYQFAHEFCHVLANPGTFVLDRVSWIEESLCEAGSLYALRSLADAWAEAPPYPNWRAYSHALAGYEDELAEGGVRALLPGERFPVWLAHHVPLLEADAGRRDDNAIIAKRLLPIFEADGAAWEVLRSLHTPRRASDGSYAAFIGELGRGLAGALPGARAGNRSGPRALKRSRYKRLKTRSPAWATPAAPYPSGRSRAIATAGGRRPRSGCRRRGTPCGRSAGESCRRSRCRRPVPSS